MKRLFFLKLGANLPVAKKRPTDLTQRPLWHVLILFVALLFSVQMWAQNYHPLAILAEVDNDRYLFFVYDDPDREIPIYNSSTTTTVTPTYKKIYKPDNGEYKYSLRWPLNCNHENRDHNAGDSKGPCRNSAKIIKIWDGYAPAPEGFATAGNNAFKYYDGDAGATNWAPWHAYHETIKRIVFLDRKYGDEICPFNCKAVKNENTEENDTTVYFSSSTYRGWFAGLENLEYVYNPQKLRLNAAKNLRGMFYGCTSLKGASPYSNYTTDAEVAKNCFFTREFGDDYGTNWDTKNVEEMADMFNGCSSLGYVDMYFINTWHVKTMNQMFQNCTSLKSLIFGPEFQTGSITNNNSVKNYKNMFNGCDALRYLDFYECKNVKANITEVLRKTNDKMFNGVPSTTIIYLPKDNIITGLYEMNPDLEESDPDADLWYLEGSTNVLADYNLQNLVYNTSEKLKCESYVSGDKTAVEIPRIFFTKRAVTKRPMPTYVKNGETCYREYGSCILPYTYIKKTQGSDILQPFIISVERTGQTKMRFEPASSVNAHAPFAFRTNKGGTNEFVMEDKDYPGVGGNYLVQIYQTRTTNSSEYSWVWTEPTNFRPTLDREKGPYVLSGAGSTISDKLLRNGWRVKGYYAEQIIEHPIYEVWSYDNNGNKKDHLNTWQQFFVAQDMFNDATKQIKMDSHRVIFEKDIKDLSPQQVKELSFEFEDEDGTTAIKATEMYESTQETEAIYDMQGRKISALQRGINIVRMTDGTVKKIIIK